MSVVETCGDQERVTTLCYVCCYGQVKVIMLVVIDR